MSDCIVKTVNASSDLQSDMNKKEWGNIKLF